ncbi:predicted protein [Postia placenta Mad-698-R]|nr:predicted protein [Postia placenta Mad-698-R]
MASAAGRKKSVISATTPTIESPIANNTLLNKAASQSTSLYQQCSALRTRLLQVQDFPEWFTVSSPPDSSRRSTDPVTQLWDCFALGVPLCYLFNLLPAPFSPINIDTDPKSFDATNEKTKKRSIALFSMQIKQLEGCEQFTVTELWDRNSTDGFVKVVNNVINLVRCLPDEVFVEPQLSSPHLASAQQSTDSLDADGAAPPPERDGGARYNICTGERFDAGARKAITMISDDQAHAGQVLPRQENTTENDRWNTVRDGRSENQILRAKQMPALSRRHANDNT